MNSIFPGKSRFSEDTAGHDYALFAVKAYVSVFATALEDPREPCLWKLFQNCLARQSYATYASCTTISSSHRTARHRFRWPGSGHLTVCTTPYVNLHERYSLNIQSCIYILIAHHETLLPSIIRHLILSNGIRPLLRLTLDELFRNANALLGIKSNNFDAIAPEYIFWSSVCRTVTNYDSSDLKPDCGTSAHPAWRHGGVESCTVEGGCWESSVIIKG
jgi:hypothetical protein